MSRGRGARAHRKAVCNHKRGATIDEVEPFSFGPEDTDNEDDGDGFTLPDPSEFGQAAAPVEHAQ